MKLGVYLLRTNVSSIILLIYILLTLFFGVNVQSSLGLDFITPQSKLYFIRYFHIPFLCIIFLLEYKNIKIRYYELFALFFSFIVMAVYTIFTKKTAIILFVNLLYEPLLLILLLRSGKFSRYSNSIWNCVIIFYLVECLLAIFESLTHISLFSTVDVLNEYINQNGDEIYSVRANSLHGHPLANAFLVVVVCTCFCLSKLRLCYRYIFFIIGVLAILAFSTRSSLIILMIPFFYMLYQDSKKEDNVWLFVVICLLSLIFVFLIYLMNELQFGLRMFDYISSDEGSTMARLVLIDVLLSLNWFDVLLGLPSETMENIRISNNLIAIENSCLLMLFNWGMLFTPFWMITMYKSLKKICCDVKAFNVLCVVIFMLWNVNNIVQVANPSMPIIIITLWAMSHCFYDNKKITVRNNESTIL